MENETYIYGMCGKQANNRFLCPLFCMDKMNAISRLRKHLECSAYLLKQLCCAYNIQSAYMVTKKKYTSTYLSLSSIL